LSLRGAKIEAQGGTPIYRRQILVARSLHAIFLCVFASLLFMDTHLS